jgi:hypothetical protein
MLQGVVKQHDPLQWSEMGLPAGLSSCLKGQITQEWLWRKLVAFISAKNWLSGSADFKTLDNKLWAVLDDMAC